jgi:hypothetical protein
MDTSQIDCYAVGFCYMSVCAPKNFSPDDLELIANLRHPTGIERKWRVSNDREFASGHPNPCQCEGNADKMHYLLEC